MVSHNYGLEGKKNITEMNSQRKKAGLKGKLNQATLLDNWQPKIAYYQHLPRANPDGSVPFPCGYKYPNQPSDSQTQLRRGKYGIFPIEWDGKCRLEAKGEKCLCNPKQEKVKEEVKVEKKSSI